MVPVSPPPPSGAASAPSRRDGERGGSAAPRWPVWLLLGVFAGLSYGLTQRLLDLRPSEEGLGGHQVFGVKAFPGTSLDGLRRSHRDGSRPLRADLDALEQERQKKKDARELEQRQADLERRDREDQERRDRQEEQLRLEELQQPPEATLPAPDLPPPPSQPLEAQPPAAGADDIQRP